MFLKCSVLFLLTFSFELSVQENKYKGESFPVKYLLPDHQIPEYSDVDYYLRGIKKMLGYFAKFANDTDINRGIGLFYMKTILKRTILENKNKIQEDQRKLMDSAILQADDILAHFFSHTVNPLKWDHILKRAAHLLKEEHLQIEAIEDFKRNRFEAWILSNITFNDFEKDMDELKMSRYDYLSRTEEVIDVDRNKLYTINIDDSDYCLGEVIYNPIPWDTKTMKPCVSDDFCAKIVYKRAPSFSYGISHRMLNIMMVHHVRRCYFQTPEDDTALMEALCSSMYREAVFLARRGYFNRDLFMEHVALCSLLGYEEFFRRHWFRKVVSWIDDQGCIAENFNYEANRTRYRLSKEPRPERRARIQKLTHDILTSKCHWHPMALALGVLAHGIRHAVHFTKDTFRDEL